jgi:hypothetical protein
VGAFSVASFLSVMTADFGMCVVRGVRGNSAMRPIKAHLAGGRLRASVQGIPIRI